MSKYPNLGILDELYKLAYGTRPFSSQEARDKICKNEKDITLFRKRIYNFRKGGYIRRDNRGNFKFTRKGISIINFAKIDGLKINELKKMAAGGLLFLIFLKAKVASDIFCVQSWRSLIFINCKEAFIFHPMFAKKK